MKKAGIIFYCILLFSCTTQNTTLSPFVTIYKRDWVGNILPEYIILRRQPNVFEIYAPIIYGSTVGEWTINNDTLFLFPKYEYFSRNSELKFLKISIQDTSITTVPHQYLIQNDCLIDITDYSIVLPELFNNKEYKALYRRVNKQ